VAAGALLSLRLPHRSPEYTHPSRGERLPACFRALQTKIFSSFFSIRPFAEGAACPHTMQAKDQLRLRRFWPRSDFFGCSNRLAKRRRSKNLRSSCGATCLAAGSPLDCPRSNHSFCSGILALPPSQFGTAYFFCAQLGPTSLTPAPDTPATFPLSYPPSSLPTHQTTRTGK